MIDENLFYRVEDARGVGPYRGKNCNECMRLIEEATGKDVVSSNDLHPPPTKDALLKRKCPVEWFVNGWYGVRFEPPQEFLFGFSSIKQMHRWFYDEAHYLAFSATGFNVCIYRGEIISGSRQAIIRKETRELITVKDACAFYDEYIQHLS